MVARVDANILTVFVINIVVFLFSIIAFYFIVRNRKSVIKSFLRFLPSHRSSEDEVVPDSSALRSPAAQPNRLLRVFGVPIADAAAMDSIVAFFKVSSVHDVLIHCGHEAAVYIVLQRILIFFMGMLAIVCTLIILPIHVSGRGSDVDRSDADTQGSVFMRTTVDHVMRDKEFLWMHVAVSICFVLAGIVCVLYWQNHPLTRTLNYAVEDMQAEESKANFAHEAPVEMDDVSSMEIGVPSGGGSNDNFAEITSVPSPGGSGVKKSMSNTSIGSRSASAASLSTRDLHAAESGQFRLAGRISNFTVMFRNLPNVVKTDDDLIEFVTHYCAMARPVKFSQLLKMQKIDDRQPLILEERDIICSRLAYDVRRLVPVDEELIHCREKWLIANGDLARSGDGTRPRKWALQARWPPVARVDAIRHYERRMKYAERDLERARNMFQEKKDLTGTGFVTFRTPELAEEVISSFTSVVSIFKVNAVSAHKAAEPEDIEWKNLGIDRHEKFARVAMVHIFLLALILFFSTPLAIVRQVTDLLSLSHVLPEAIFAVLPTLLLLVVIFVLPVVINALTGMEGHKLKSNVMYRCFERNFLYFLLSSLVLPMVSLTLIDALRKYDQKQDILAIMEDAFLPQAGGFFLSYVIQAAFIGNAIDLLRVAETWLRAITTKKPISAEEGKILDRMSPFEYHVHTPFMLSIVAIVLSYSLFAPLITLVGFFFVFCKHFVDQYNLMTVHPPSSSDSLSISVDLYRSKLLLICRFILASLIIFQLYVFYFCMLKDMHGPAAVAMVCAVLVFVVMCVFYTGYYKKGIFEITDAQPVVETAEVKLAYVCPQLRGLEPYKELAKLAASRASSMHLASGHTRAHSQDWDAIARSVSENGITPDTAANI